MIRQRWESYWGSSGGKSILAEIKAIHQAILKLGGPDEQVNSCGRLVWTHRSEFCPKKLTAKNTDRLTADGAPGRENSNLDNRTTNFFAQFGTIQTATIG
jgi:hypothetical protein